VEQLALGAWLALGLLFWIGLYYLSRWILGGFYEVELFGRPLVRKLLEILLLASFVLLVLSNVITALSAFYLSDDLQLLKVLPIGRRRLFYSRAMESLAASSWMLLLFALPVLLAFGAVTDAGPWWFPVVLAVFTAFLCVPAALGLLAATILVRVFPAQRSREFMAAIGVFTLGGLFLLLRWVQPERMLAAGSFDSVVPFLRYLQTPTMPWMPAQWARDVLLHAAGLSHDPSWISALLLFSSAPASLILARWVVAPLETGGFTRAQESAPARLGAAKWFQALLRAPTSLLPEPARSVVRKDVRTLVRDAGQWSQVFLLAALVAIYLFNIRVLPIHGGNLPKLQIGNILSFLNIGLVAFVVAALAVRLAYPSISFEGRAFWMLRTSPLSMRGFILAKLVYAGLPLLLLGEFLVIVSNEFLQAAPLFRWLGVALIAVLAPGVVALALGMGARSPDFKADSAARLAASPGAILFMVVASIYIGGVLFACAWPVTTIVAARLRDQTIHTGYGLMLGGVLAAAALVGILVPMWVLLSGARSLETAEGA
jgi:ABC-2 type transport system permease protein